MKKYCVNAKDKNGEVMVGYDNKVTYCLDNAMMFDTLEEANNWIAYSSQAKEWLVFDQILEVCEVEL